MRAHPPMPLQVSRHASLAAPPSPAHRSPMHAAVSALQDFSQRGAATAEDAMCPPLSHLSIGMSAGPARCRPPTTNRRETSHVARSLPALPWR